MATTKFKFTRAQRARLERLLHMEYTLRELAEELHCTKRQLRSAIEAGCPHRRTKSGRIWVTGDKLRDWYLGVVAERRTPLRDDQAYCLRCKAAVGYRVVAVHPCPDGVLREEGVCLTCGATVNRFRKADREAAQ